MIPLAKSLRLYLEIVAATTYNIYKDGGACGSKVYRLYDRAGSSGAMGRTHTSGATLLLIGKNTWCD